MPDTNSLQDGFLAKLGAGLAGSLVSLKFVKGTAFERVLMVIGGVMLSFYATPVSVQFLGMNHSEGLIGFLLGLFGMAVVAKAYEALQAVDAGDLSKRVVNWIAKRFGA